MSLSLIISEINCLSFSGFWSSLQSRGLRIKAKTFIELNGAHKDVWLEESEGVVSGRVPLVEIEEQLKQIGDGHQANLFR